MMLRHNNSLQTQFPLFGATSGRRLPDLERDVLVERCDMGVCDVAARSTITWRAL